VDENDENIDYSNINHLLHVLRNPYGWNGHVIETVRLKAADELERLNAELRRAANEL
jgi:hypothetical protein